MQIIIDIIIFLFSVMILLLIILYIWRLWTAVANSSLDNILLEIKIPSIVDKSPKAMELALETLIQNGGVSTWFKREIKGASPAQFSLEIASLEGQIHFYIRTQSKFKQIIESALYANYPNIEIVKADDYVFNIFYEHRTKKVDLWGCEYKLGEKFTLPIKNNKRVNANKVLGSEPQMPADIIPIKTYVDYGMDKNPKDEYIIDPLLSILEWLNSMGPGEFGYYQILLQPEDKFDGGNFSKNYACSTTGEEFTSKELGNEYVESLRLGGGYKLIKVGDIIYDDYGNPRKTSKKIKEKYIDPADGKEKERDVTVEENMKYGDNYFNADEKKQGYKIVYLSKENEQNIKQEIKDRIKQVGNKLGKTRMRSIIRAMYIADKSHSNKVQNIQTTLALMRPFGSPGYNSFSPTPTSPFDNDWEDVAGVQTPWLSEEMFFNYVERGGFYKHIEKRNNSNLLLKIIPLFYWKLLRITKFDDVIDVIFAKKTFAHRYTFRYLWEIIIHPTHHPRVQPQTLSLEEIATLWHLPNTGASISGISKISIKNTSSPNNLPL